MVNNHGEEMRKRSELIMKTLEALDKKIESFPNGRIKIKKCKSGVYHYLSIKGKKDRLLNENETDLIRDLIQKSYLTESIEQDAENLSFCYCRRSV